jgi:hypothetical protein
VSQAKLLAAGTLVPEMICRGTGQGDPLAAFVRLAWPNIPFGNVRQRTLSSGYVQHRTLPSCDCWKPRLAQSVILGRDDL